MQRLLSYCLLFGVLSSPFVMANEPNFSYSSFGLVFGKSDVSGFDDDLIDMGVKASLEIEKGLFLFADLMQNRKDNIDASGVDVQVDQIRAGVGFAFPVQADLDLVTSVSYVKTGAELCLQNNCQELKDKSWRLDAEANYWLTANMDASVNIGYLEYDQGDQNETLYGVGFGYWPAQNHRIGLSYQVFDEANSVAVNYRISQ
ncbi:MAG: outer membrane beta-barrel protein [Thiotrichales bacterium]|nr:outer membrane beta-barrel protein [Thiotrichales bacterium]